MKLVTFSHEGTQHVGRVDGDTVIELAVPSMRAYFEAGSPAKETGRQFTTSSPSVSGGRIRSPRGSSSFRTSMRSSAPTSRSSIPIT